MKEARKNALTVAHLPGLTPDEGVSGVTQAGTNLGSSTDVSESIPELGDDNLIIDPGTVPPPPMKEDPYIGKTIDGRYLVEQVLGEGGMGVVYRGRHKVIDKRVAIKVLRSEMSRDAEMTERFLQEARAASSIGNAHIVDISDFGQLPDGATYFVMEHLDGGGLGALLETSKGAPLGVMRIVHIAKQIALGLHAAHQAGIVHRDLKPDNVMLINRGADKDFVKILDFGIAKVGDGTARLTRAGSVFGTPHYMSPEQAAGTVVDQRTDIYSLGVILYEMASGRVPFDADNFMGILTQHMYKAPPSILALVPPPGDVPPGLDAIVLKCLSKKPDNRYSSMADLAEDFERLEKGGAPLAVAEMMSRSGGFNVPADYFRSAMPAPVPATPYARNRSRMPLFAVIGGVAALGVVALATILIPGKQSVAQPREVAVAATVPVAAMVTAAATTHAPNAVPSKQVLVTVEPSGAKVIRDGTPLAEDPPLLIEVKAGETIVLVARRSGYRDQTITLNDESAAKMMVKMSPVPGSSQTWKPAPKSAPLPDTKAQAAPKAASGSDFNDPWKK